MIALAAILVDVPAAFGTMPGEVGKIGYTQIKIGLPVTGSLRAINPDGSGATEVVPPQSFMGRYSPDGKWIAYSTADNPFGGAARLAVAPVDGSSAPRDLKTGSALNFQPTWSPDGNRIAYLRVDAQILSLRVVNADGSNDQEVAHLGIVSDVDQARDAGTSWSPDGKRIATSAPHALGDGLHVITVDVETGDKMDLTPPDGDHTGWPSYHPDGSRIAYAKAVDLGAPGTQTGIYSRPAGGGAETEIVAPTEDGGANLPSYSPDGTAIALIKVDGTDLAGALGVVPSGGGDVTTLLPVDLEKQTAYGAPDWQPIKSSPQPPPPQPPVNPTPPDTPGGGVVPPPPPGPPGPPSPPAMASVSSVRLTNARFRVGAKPTPINAGRRSRRRVPTGTEFRFRLSNAAPVSLAIQRSGPGVKLRRPGQRQATCVAATRANRGALRRSLLRQGSIRRLSGQRRARALRRAMKRASCTHYKTVGTLSRQGVAGQNRVPFTGRIGTKKLSPGRYRVAISSTAPGERNASFTVVR